MSLLAWVYCNCIETGRLLTPSPVPNPIEIDETGQPDIVSDDPQVHSVFNVWRYRSACPHYGGMLVCHRIGGVGHVTFLRETIYHLAGGWEAADAQYPVLLRRVICNGVHSGDWIDLDQAHLLYQEMERLRPQDITALSEEDAGGFKEFQTQMDDLVAAALQVGKPICF